MKETSDRFDFKVEWFPFFLDPTLPEQGVVKLDHYKRKFGPSVDSMLKRMIPVGEKEGIKFSYGGKIANTFNSHRLINFAKKFDKEDQVVSVLFRNYFEEEKSLGDFDVLIAAGKEAGLDEAKVTEFLKSDEDKDFIKHQATEAVEDMGVSGVPFFILNDKYAISGAQESTTFIGLFDKLSKM